jgi:hypothetical protein
MSHVWIEAEKDWVPAATIVAQRDALVDVLDVLLRLDVTPGTGPEHTAAYERARTVRDAIKRSQGGAA